MESLGDLGKDRKSGMSGLRLEDLGNQGQVRNIWVIWGGIRKSGYFWTRYWISVNQGKDRMSGDIWDNVVEFLVVSGCSGGLW